MYLLRLTVRPTTAEGRPACRGGAEGGQRQQRISDLYSGGGDRTSSGRQLRSVTRSRPPTISSPTPTIRIVSADANHASRRAKFKIGKPRTAPHMTRDVPEARGPQIARHTRPDLPMTVR